MSQLLSKLVAGGLSASVILLWWPHFFHGDSVEAWLARGVIWTLSFELLLHALAPLEEALWRTTAAGRVRSRAAAAGTRLAGTSPRARFGGRGVLACLALAIPVWLLTVAPAPPSDDERQAAPVKHVTQIKRVVRVERPAADGGAQVAPVTADAARPEAPVAGTRPDAPVASTHRVAKRRAAAPTTRRPGRSPSQAPQREPRTETPAPTGVDTNPAAPETSQPVREPVAEGSSLRTFAG